MAKNFNIVWRRVAVGEKMEIKRRKRRAPRGPSLVNRGDSWYNNYLRTVAVLGPLIAKHFCPQVCKIANPQVRKFTNTQIHKSANPQIHNILSGGETMAMLEFILNLVINLGLFVLLAASISFAITFLAAGIAGGIIGHTMSHTTYPFLMERQRGFSLEHNDEASRLDMSTRNGIWRAIMVTIEVIVVFLVLRFRPPLDITFTVFGMELHIWMIVIYAAVLISFMKGHSLGHTFISECPAFVVDFVEYNTETDIAKYDIRMSDKWLGDHPKVLEVECEHDEGFIEKYCHSRSKFVVTDVADGRIIFMELDMHRWMSSFREYDT